VTEVKLIKHYSAETDEVRFRFGVHLAEGTADNNGFVIEKENILHVAMKSEDFDLLSVTTFGKCLIEMGNTLINYKK
jgi:hypothetical protein